MNFINLFMNEFIKIIRKKCTVIFIVLSVLSLLFSCALVYVKKTNFYVGGGKVTIVDADNAKLNLDRYEYLITKTQDPMDIKLINMLIGNYKYLLELGIDNVMDAEYKSKAFYSINKCCRKLCSLDEVANKEEYQKQEENISRLWQIIKSGTFEEYLLFLNSVICFILSSCATSNHCFNSATSDSVIFISGNISPYLFTESLCSI